MKTKHVLFVDDDFRVRDCFKNVFLPSLGTKCQLVITACANIADAKDAFKQRPDVVISDYLMNETEDGLDFFHHVNTIDPKQPFILFTGVDDLHARPILNELEISENLYFAAGKEWDILRQILLTLLEEDESSVH
jgi:DNA-binding NtrC family response regulator